MTYLRRCEYSVPDVDWQSLCLATQLLSRAATDVRIPFLCVERDGAAHEHSDRLSALISFRRRILASQACRMYAHSASSRHAATAHDAFSASFVDALPYVCRPTR